MYGEDNGLMPTVEDSILARKKRLHLLDWPELEAASYPTYFTVVLTYGATGEGVTHGVAMGYAHQVNDIRKAIHEHFGEYFGQFAEVTLGLSLLPGYKDLVPALTRKVIRDIHMGNPPGRFHFHVVHHINVS